MCPQENRDLVGLEHHFQGEDHPLPFIDTTAVEIHPLATWPRLRHHEIDLFMMRVLLVVEWAVKALLVPIKGVSHRIMLHLTPVARPILEDAQLKIWEEWRRRQQQHLMYRPMFLPTANPCPVHSRVDELPPTAVLPIVPQFHPISCRRNHRPWLKMVGLGIFVPLMVDDLFWIITHATIEEWINLAGGRGLRGPRR